MESKENNHRAKNIDFSRKFCAFLCGFGAVFCLGCAIYRLVYAVNCRETVLALDINSLSAAHAAEYMRLLDGAKYSACAALLLAALGCAAAGVGFLGEIGIIAVPEKLCEYSPALLYAFVALACFAETRGRAVVVVCGLCFIASGVLLLPLDLSMGGKVSFGLGSKIDLAPNSRFRMITAAGLATLPVVAAAVLSFFSKSGALMFFALMTALACACGCAWCRLYKEIEI